MSTPRFNHFYFIVLVAFAFYSCKSKTPSNAEAIDSATKQTFPSKTSDMSPFENTMGQTSAVVIKEDIEQKGKFILPINFSEDLEK